MRSIECTSSYSVPLPPAAPAGDQDQAGGGRAGEGYSWSFPPAVPADDQAGGGRTQGDSASLPPSALAAGDQAGGGRAGKGYSSPLMPAASADDAAGDGRAEGDSLSFPPSAFAGNQAGGSRDGDRGPPLPPEGAVAVLQGGPIEEPIANEVPDGIITFYPSAQDFCATCSKHGASKRPGDPGAPVTQY